MVDASNFRGRVDLNDHGSWQGVASLAYGRRSGSWRTATAKLPAIWTCQAGSRLAFRMISFSSLVALVISRSSAATA